MKGDVVKAAGAAVSTFLNEVLFKKKKVGEAVGSALKAGGKHLKVQVSGSVKSISKSISNKPQKVSSLRRRRSISFSSRRRRSVSYSSRRRRSVSYSSRRRRSISYSSRRRSSSSSSSSGGGGGGGGWWRR